MEVEWTAEQIALQTLVWLLVFDGAVGAEQLASEFERCQRFVRPKEAKQLKMLASLARAAVEIDR